MPRWTVVHAGQTLVLESTPDGRFQLGTITGDPWVTDAQGLRELRRRLGVAIGEAQAGDSDEAHDGGPKESQRGDGDV